MTREIRLMPVTLKRSTVGIDWGIRASHVALLAEVESRLARDWAETPGEAVIVYDLEQGTDELCLRLGEFELVTGSLDQVVSVLEDSVPVHLARLARQRLFVHGLAVCRGDQALLVPRYRFQGRQATDSRPSDMAAALAEHGVKVLSLRLAALDESGLVHPFPAPWYTEQERVCCAELASQADPVPLTKVLLLEPGWPSPLQRHSQAKGLAEVLANTVLARFDHQATLDRLAPLSDKIAFYSAGWATRDEAIGHVLNLFQGEQCHGRISL